LTPASPNPWQPLPHRCTVAHGTLPSATMSGSIGALCESCVGAVVAPRLPSRHRVQFATASQWVDKLADAQTSRWLQAELLRLSRHPLLVIDEVGYIPFEPEAANLFFQLVSSRYERASMIVTSNKPFGRWGEVFGDEVVAAAMIDRLVHHAEVVSLRGDSYRLKDRNLGRTSTANNEDQ
jgi:DNA replication protein DnaC